MNMWQPIETAPKDGTKVLLFGLWCGEINGVFDLPSIEVGYFNGPDGWKDFNWMATGGDCYVVTGCPTHWMPLPNEPI
jgi:hypothetical protein